MKLKRLIEMIQQDSAGADEWPVLFTSYFQSAAGEWQEVEGVRQPITSVKVEEAEDAAESEVLLITDSEGSPLLLAQLMEELAELLPCCGEFTVDNCDTPIELDDGGTIHIDIPVCGVGRDEKKRCYLILYASKEPN
jgi:hypothetical protein